MFYIQMYAIMEYELGVVNGYTRIIRDGYKEERGQIQQM